MVADVLSFAHKFQATIARAPSMSDPSSPTDVPPPHIHLQSAPFLSDGPTVDDLLAHSRSPSAPGRFPSTSDEGGVPPLPYRRRARTADPLSTAHTQRSQPVTTRPFVNVPGAPEYTPLSSPLSDPDANRSRVHTKTIETDVNTFRALLPTYISFTTSVDPYVHAGALGVVTFFGYIAGRLGLSWMWIVAAWVVGLHALYQARELVRARVKWESERIEGALKIEKPGEEGESAEWINFLLAQLWPIMDRNLFAKVIDILEDNFHQFAPPMIADIQVVDFDLGMHAPRLSNIKVLPHGCGTDTVLMDCTVSLQPVPYTVYAGENIETGPVGGQSIYVLLNARIGKAQLGTVTVPIVIESVGFEARARVQIVLYDKPPFARHLRFTLLTPPRVTFAARPLKLVNVMSLPLLSQFIQKVVDETVKMLAVNPNAVSLDLEQILLGKETLDDVTSIGVLKIVIHEAKDLMAADVTGTSDPFVAIDYGGLETHKISSLSLTGLGVDKATGPITGGLTAVQTLAASDLASVRPTPTDVRSTSPPPTIGSPENLSDLGGDAETPLTDTSGLSTAYYHVLRPLGQTRVIPKSTDPVFNETHYIRVTSADVINTLPLRLRVFDFDTFTKDDLLGVLEFSLRDVVDRPGVEAVKGWYPLRFPGVDTTKNPATGNTVALADADALLGGSSKHVRFPVPKLAYGELKVSVQFLPKVVVPKVGFVESFLEPKKSVVNVKEMADKYPGGILSIHIHQCADLIVKATERAGPYPSSFVDVHLNDEHVFRTRAKPSNPSPYINAMTEHYVRDWRRAVVRLAIRDQRALERDPTIGSAVVGLEELFADDIGMLLTKWFYLKNGIGAGRIRVSFIFRPVQAQEPAHLRGYPTGVLQLRSISLHDFASLHHRKLQNEEQMVQAFVRVLFPLGTPEHSETKAYGRAHYDASWGLGSDSPQSQSPPMTLMSKVVNRYQTEITFEVHVGKESGHSKVVGKMMHALSGKGGGGGETRRVATGRMWAGDLIDGVETEVVLTLERHGRNRTRGDVMGRRGSAGSGNSSVGDLEDEAVMFEGQSSRSAASSPELRHIAGTSLAGVATLRARVVFHGGNMDVHEVEEMSKSREVGPVLEELDYTEVELVRKRRQPVRQGDATPESLAAVVSPTGAGSDSSPQRIGLSVAVDEAWPNTNPTQAAEQEDRQSLEELEPEYPHIVERVVRTEGSKSQLKTEGPSKVSRVMEWGKEHVVGGTNRVQFWKKSSRAHLKGAARE